MNSLHIDNSAALQACGLQDSDAKVIDGNVLIFSAGTSMRNLGAITGDLLVFADDLVLPALTRLDGSLTIRGSNASLPKLDCVGKTVQIDWMNSCLPSLKTIGGSLLVWKSGCEMPKLTRVGDAFRCATGVTFDTYGIEFGAGAVIAHHDLSLHVDPNGLYRTVFDGPFTSEEALSHWSDDSKQSGLFRQAILQHEGIHVA